MHDAPFPRLIALLLSGACRAGKNTYYPDRRRPARAAPGARRPGEIVMAHRFSTMPLGFSVMGARML
jgi:hypothetical protein